MVALYRSSAIQAHLPRSRRFTNSTAFFEWRGQGPIDHSGVRLRDIYAAFDAERIFAMRNVRIADRKACQCGGVLKGLLRPHQCMVFGNACTPETPLGSLMVSLEEACTACYRLPNQHSKAVAGRERRPVNLPPAAGIWQQMTQVRCRAKRGLPSSVENAAVSGEVTEQRHDMVMLHTAPGDEQIVRMPNGEQLPRIC